ncbi:MAG: hypothetical protein ABI091_26620 [Ferruginibacter sp.]
MIKSIKKIGKIKVVFILSNGQKMVVKCKKFSITKLTGTIGKRELSIENTDRLWSIDLDLVVGVTAKWVLI